MKEALTFIYGLMLIAFGAYNFISIQMPSHWIEWIQMTISFLLIVHGINKIHKVIL